MINIKISTINIEKQKLRKYRIVWVSISFIRFSLFIMVIIIIVKPSIYRPIYVLPILRKLIIILCIFCTSNISFGCTMTLLV